MMDRGQDVPPSTEGNKPNGEEENGIDTTVQTTADDVVPQQEYYYTNQFENYYYEPSDGNYYYYSVPDATGNEEAQKTGEVPLTQENLLSLYEFEEWEPRSYGWFADVIIDVFVSLGFRLYLFSLLYSFGVLLLTLSLNWTFQILFRIYAPRPGDSSDVSEVLSYCVVFLYLSFTLVIAFCVWIDMLKALWYVKRDDTSFLGIFHHSGQRPPFIVYSFLIFATTVFPFFFGIVETGIRAETFVYLLRTHIFVSVIVTGFIFVACYIWFFFQALKRKRLAFKKRLECDEFSLWEKASKYSTKQPIKKHWYHASTVLEEYGLDGKAIRWNAFVITISGVPLFALYASQALSTYIGPPSAFWGACSSIFLSVVYIIAWVTLFRTKAHWSLYASVSFLVILFLIGMIGGAISNSKGTMVLLLVLFITSHGTLARKRRHKLTRKEQCALFQINVDPAMHHKTPKRLYDIDLFCCRDVILSCLKRFDVKTLFGYHHPDIIRAQRQYSLNNVTVVADQKVLMCWWFTVLFVLAFVIGLGNSLAYHYTDKIALQSQTPISGGSEEISFCTRRYNVDGSAPLGFYDLSLLSALSYTFGTQGDSDFVTWFSHLQQFVRQYPIQLPPKWNYATDGVSILFSDYVDLTSDYHVVILNANNRGMSLMRSIDEWGTSIAFQVASLLSPLIGLWPEKYQASFIHGASFIQRWFSRTDVLNEVSAYIDGLISTGKKERILLVGDGFNGGYANILSSVYGIPFVALNPPGTMHEASQKMKGVQVLLSRGLFSYVKPNEETKEVFYLQCNASYSQTRCSRIEGIIEAILSICGDPYGRNIK